MATTMMTTMSDANSTMNMTTALPEMNLGMGVNDATWVLISTFIIFTMQSGTKNVCNLVSFLCGECAEALGFVKSSLTGRNQYARYAPDITRGRHSLFVYCNVVDSQIVGDVYAPLLRTVAIRGERGSIVTETYDRLHYVPVNTKELSTLEFSIRDDAGDHIKFDSGKIICKLHFRPKSL